MEHRRTGRIVLHDTFENQWLEFADPRQVLRADDPEDVRPLLRQVSRKVEEEGFYAAGFLSYDASPAFDEALKARRREGFPLIWFGLYDAPSVLLLPRPEKETAGLPWTPTLTRGAYNDGIRRVKEYIRQGQTYQVNYTYRLRCRCEEDPWQLFLAIQAAQNARYGAYADIADWTVCSASPELFFTLEGNRITARPMKGTAPRGTTLPRDREMAQWLYRSEKNRAENRMIVDMIRNDLGRVASTGSVKVPELFSLEKYPTLWQMTTRVTAETDRSVPEIFDALFPCASITGAPKYRTMEIIRELETTPRGLYTGSIGYMAPGRKAQFNVAIRTVTIRKRSQEAEYGTGGGIIWDSTAGEEWEETQTKARILSRKVPEFSLLESLGWDPEEGYFLLDRHLDRMGESAEYFGFPFDRAKARSLLLLGATDFQSKPRKIRLLLEASGKMICEETAPRGKPEWTVALAQEPVNSSDPFLYHKTTHRDIYARMKSQCPGADDVLLWNERGEITESCVGNVIVTLGGQAFTPPVECGLLAGTYRQELLSRGELTERIITLEELQRAEKILLINSVRKVQTIRFHWKNQQI